MKRIAALSLVALAAFGCASARSDSGLGQAKVKLIEPEITIRQISEVPAAAKYVSGSLPIHYVIRVANRSNEPITLTRVNVQSLGEGAYTLRPTTVSIKKTKIDPDHFETADFWAPAYIDDVTVYGANGPVTLRLIAHFDSPVGQFDQVSVLQVHDRPTDTQSAQ